MAEPLTFRQLALRPGWGRVADNAILLGLGACLPMAWSGGWGWGIVQTLLLALLLWVASIKQAAAEQLRYFQGQLDAWTEVDRTDAPRRWLARRLRESA